MDNSTTTRLLTLLNVSATKKQKWNEDTPVSKKSNKRVSVKIAGPDTNEKEHANDASLQEDTTVPTEETEDLSVEGAFYLPYYRDSLSFMDELHQMIMIHTNTILVANRLPCLRVQEQL